MICISPLPARGPSGLCKQEGAGEKAEPRRGLSLSLEVSSVDKNNAEEQAWRVLLGPGVVPVDKNNAEEQAWRVLLGPGVVPDWVPDWVARERPPSYLC